VKIKYELKQKQVSDYSIKKALKQISEEDYLRTLNRLTTEKYASLKNDQYLVRMKKTMDYLFRRGFEAELINEAIKTITEKK
jgi:regulatory protein